MKVAKLNRPATRHWPTYLAGQRAIPSAVGGPWPGAAVRWSFDCAIQPRVSCAEKSEPTRYCPGVGVYAPPPMSIPVGGKAVTTGWSVVPLVAVVQVMA